MNPFSTGKMKINKGSWTEINKVAKKEIAAEVIDAIADSIVALNLDGKIIAINPAYTKMFGYKPGEM